MCPCDLNRDIVLSSHLASGRRWKNRRKAGVCKLTSFKRTPAIAQGRGYVTAYHIPFQADGRQAIEKWLPVIRERYPCVDAEDFQTAVDFHTSTSASRPDPAARTPLPIHRPRPVPSPQPQPQPQPQPEPACGSAGASDGDWGASDPWADKNSGGQGSGNWDTSDPWADKNRGGRSSW
jgi:hypothetical protein